jgi:hypothetical protein
MTEIPPGLRPGQHLQCILADGTVFSGHVDNARKGWLRLTTEQGPLLINVAHVALLKPLDASAVGIGLGSSEPETTASRRSAGTTTAEDDWDPESLRALADGFLDGHDDSELAARLGQRKGQVKTLRQAFECARGNLVEDEIAPTAREWIDRWRSVLAG